MISKTCFFFVLPLPCITVFILLHLCKYVLCVYNCNGYLCRSSRLHTLAKALSPAYLRLGGTAADFLIFQQNFTGSAVQSTNCWLPQDCTGGVMTKNFTNFYMSGLREILLGPALFVTHERVTLFCCV